MAGRSTVKDSARGRRDRLLGNLSKDQRDAMSDQIQQGTASVLTLGAEFTPGVGDAMSAKEAYDAYQKGNIGEAALLAILTGIGLVPGIGDGVSKVGTAAVKRAMRNELVHPAVGAVENMLDGRVPKSLNDILYGSRRTNMEELLDASEKGEFLPNPAKRYSTEDVKWWSGADESGIFGRPWIKGGADPFTVRVPKGNLPPDSPVLAEHAQVLASDGGKAFNEFMQDYKKKKATGGPVEINDRNPAKRRRLI